MSNVMITYGRPWNVPNYGGGGGIYTSGDLQLTYVVIYDNQSNGLGVGGGIWNNGILTLSHVVIQENYTPSSNTVNSSGHGGGIYNTSFGSITATDVFITGNHTGNNTSTGQAGWGGGIYNAPSGSVTLTRTTVSDNWCGYAEANNGAHGGGIFNEGFMTIQVSTISSNNSGTAHTGDHNGGSGGGIYSRGTTNLEISDTTITNDSTGYSSGTGTARGGGISVDLGSTEISNTIIANNTAELADDCYAGFESEGFNLIEDITGCTITGITDTITGQDPLLASLADLGVEGWMHALRPGSPAIDTGSGACDYADQRSIIRPVDGDRDGSAICDIGSFEARLIDFLPYFENALLPAIYKP